VKKYEFLTFFTKSSKSGKTAFFAKNDDAGFEKEVFLRSKLTKNTSLAFFVKIEKRFLQKFQIYS
jgi:hypothetical protein